MNEYRIQQIVPPPSDSDHSPPSDHSSGAPSEQRKQFGNLDRYRVYMIWLFQFVVVVGALIVCVRIGASWWFLLPGTVALLAIFAYLGKQMWTNAQTDDPLSETSVLLRLMKWGIVVTSASLLVAARALYLRIDWEAHAGLGWTAIAFLLILSGLMLIQGLQAVRMQVTPWFQFAIGVTIIPVLASWTVATVSSSVLYSKFQVSRFVSQMEPERQKTLKERATWATDPGWISPKSGSPVTVAVALSGGGYRAALVHAGLLSALDEICVPIQVLSTVSGGSIIGTFYALGYSPQVFMNNLRVRKPGLPDDILSLWFVLSELVSREWGTSETYSYHFANLFFESKTFSHLPNLPQLVINATDIQLRADLAPEVFYKNRAPSDSTLNARMNDTHLSDAIAASAAFPGAFEPKSLAWVDPVHSGIIVSRRFIDGGVIDNIGIVGLARYSGLSGTAIPNILIVSDAGKASAVVTLPVKVDPLRLLARSYGLTHDAHQSLLAEQVLHLSEHFPDIKPYLIRSFDDDVMASLKQYQFTHGTPPFKDGEQVAREVSTFDTLKELDELQVEKAYWLGNTLGVLHRGVIEGARRSFTSNSTNCPKTGSGQF